MRALRRPWLAGAFLLIFFIPSLAWPGEWHQKGQLACSDCHTMHNSLQGQPMRYDNQPEPSPHLLRHASTMGLCLYCHDGSYPNAPDVVAPVTYVEEPLGGFFEFTEGTSERGHDLGALSGEQAPGGSDLLILTCSSCHDIHGNTNYRNLLLNPDGSGNGEDVLIEAMQKFVANGSNPREVYVSQNVVYRKDLSRWCNDCHPDFHGSSPGEEGTASPWFRHPQEKAIADSVHADYQHWSSGVNEAQRVPVANPSDTTIPSSDDQVFCLSCHRAHGTANRAALIYADRQSLKSTCQQCHNH